jgi:DNA polymerase III epsilon subunit-like protein
MMRNFVYIDTETGGLDHRVHGLTEIGAIAFELDPFNGHTRLLDKYNVLIEPQLYLAYTPYALEMQKRTLKDLEELGATEIDALRGLGEFICRNVMSGWTGRIVAHNAEFDYKFLAALSDRHEAGMFQSDRHNKWICTQQMFRMLQGLGVVMENGAGLDDIINYYNIPANANRRHTALVDAEYGVQVFGHMIADLNRFYQTNGGPKCTQLLH